MATQGSQPEEQQIQDRRETTCCIVGGGPAGTLLALLLVRQGIDVTLLEAHTDFDRDFRGDTIHPAILDILDEVGLADRLLERPHRKVRKVAVPLGGKPTTVADLGRLKTRFPFVALLPQSEFLDFLAAEANHYPNFHLVMGANVQALVEDRGKVRGVRYRGREGWHEVRAQLTVGADGRFSKVRQLSGLPAAVATSPPMDILWFRLPRLPSDPEGVMGNYGRGRVLIVLDRGEQWQLGYVFPKGGYTRLRQEGLPALRQGVAELAPFLADRLDSLTDWQQVSLLSVASDHLPRWFRPGLLLIGDAAHVMSPVGGNGINYAVQDAAAAAKFLAQPLLNDSLSLADLAAVQHRREWPTRLTQAIVTQLQNHVLAPILASDRPFEPAAALTILPRVPFLRDLPARWVAFGIWPVHLS